MICDLPESILGMDERICPADHAAIAPQIDFTRLTHCNCRQWKEGDTTTIFALQIGYGSLCRVRVLCDNISHAPAERNIDGCKIALWYTNEIGNRSGNTSAPPFRCLQDGLHIPPESLIAVLHTPLKIKALTDTKDFRLRLPKLSLITLDCSAQLLGFTVQSIAFLRDALHILFRKDNFLPLVLKFIFDRCKECTAALHFCRLLLLAFIPLLCSAPSYGKLLSQTRQYTLYGSTCRILPCHFLFFIRKLKPQTLGLIPNKRLLLLSRITLCALLL